MIPENPIGARVALREVSKRFADGPVIIEGIELGVEPGEFVSLVGPSGCGKSTLLRLIAGLSPCTDGSVEIDGEAPGDIPSEIAFVFQDPTLLPWRNVAENVDLPLHLRGANPDFCARARKQALALAGLTGREAAYPRQLSGGQRMRASLARALTLSPRLLLLDEPFGALDEMSRERLNEELLAIQRRQRWTAFFVTHSVPEAVFLSHRVVVLSPQPGKVAAIVPIKLPENRTADIRLQPDFQAAVTEVSRKLRQFERVPAK